MTTTNSTPEKKSGSKILGCLGQIITFIIVIFVSSGVRTCTKKQIERGLECNYEANMGEEKSYSDEDIKFAVESTKQSLPRKVDEYTTAVDFDCTDKAVIYTYEIDDSDIDLSTIDAEDVKHEIAGTFDKSNHDMCVLAHFCIDSGRNWNYIYKGKYSDYRISFSFTPEELKKVFN